MDSKKITLGQKIKEARISNKMTQSELAGNHITRNMLSQIENDVANPSIKTLEYLANVLNLPVSYFIEDSTPSSISNPLEPITTALLSKDYSTCVSLLDSLFSADDMNIYKPLLCSLYALCLTKLATLAKNSGDYSLAENYYMQSRELFEKNDLPILNKQSEFLFLSEIQMHLNQPPQVHKYFTNAENDFLLIQQVHTLHQMAYELSLCHFDATLSLAKSIKDIISTPHDHAFFNYICGTANLNIGKYNKALACFKVCLPFYQGHHNRLVIAKVLKSMSECYSKLNDFENAYKCLAQAEF